MDFQFWVWLIIVVATLVSRALKKTSKDPNSPSEHPRTESNTPDRKPMTFEEMLREIQTSKTPASPADRRERSKPIQASRPIRSYEVDYDDDLGNEERDLETIPADDNRSTEIYEKAKKEAFSRPSLEDTLKLEDTIMRYGHFKGYEEAPKNTLASDVLKDFKDPDGFRKAFIMSEILKPKF
jgi:hypothetical protein